MKILWTEYAAADLDSIYSFIASDSEYYARSFILTILHAAREVTDLNK